MSDIFISYAREDRPRAAQLAHAFEAQGWSVFWDRDIPAGETWHTWVGKALDEARCVMVAWSVISIDSRWVREEADDGLERSILVPVLFEGVKPPIGFRSIQAADLVAWDGTTTADAFEQLVDDVARLLGPPPRIEGERREAEAAPEAKRKRSGEGGGAEPLSRAEAPAPTMKTAPTSKRRPLPKGADDPLNRPIWIEGGTFLMGSEDNHTNERPVHKVTVSGFWMQEHPVTNEEYRRFVAGHQFPSGKERHPVVNVNWQQAMDYAASRGGSLATEAQWEFAARGTEGRTYPWGDPQPDDSRANFGDPSRGTRPVGSYPAGATPEGVHDLAGNVWEWVGDWYGKYLSGAVTDPTGPPSGSSRVVRGGSFNFETDYLRGSDRVVVDPGGDDVRGGFRVAWAGGQ